MKRRYGRDAILALASASLLPHRTRVNVYRAAGINIGRGVHMLAGTRVAGDGLIEIGDNVFINADCYFDAAANIEIGTGVRIADHVRLITSSHQVGLKSRRAGEGLAKPIHIGEGAWIGSSSLILPGVTVASGCIIGAGSVVAKSTDSDGLYLGVPARRVRDLSE